MADGDIVVIDGGRFDATDGGEVTIQGGEIRIHGGEMTVTDQSCGRPRGRYLPRELP